MIDPQLNPTDMNFDSLMTQALNAVPQEKISGLQAVIQVNTLEDSPRACFWTIREGQCTFQQGKAENPSLTLEATPSDFMKIVTGKLSPMAAAALGRLQVTGNMQLAMSMANIFKNYQNPAASDQVKNTG